MSSIDNQFQTVTMDLSGDAHLSLTLLIVSHVCRLEEKFVANTGLLYDSMSRHRKINIGRKVAFAHRVNGENFRLHDSWWNDQ